jgi:hypothetical protein
MKQQYFSVRSPLTIIALFMGLTEIALGLVAVFSQIPLDLQKVLVRFMVVFPTLCAIGFFVILFFHPRHLYSPGDFRSDGAYLAASRDNLDLKAFGSGTAKDSAQREMPNADILRAIVSSLSDVHSWYLFKVANKTMTLKPSRSTCRGNGTN